MSHHFPALPSRDGHSLPGLKWAREKRGCFKVIFISFLHWDKAENEGLDFVLVFPSQSSDAWLEQGSQFWPPLFELFL